MCFSGAGELMMSRITCVYCGLILGSSRKPVDMTALSVLWMAAASAIAVIAVSRQYIFGAGAGLSVG